MADDAIYLISGDRSLKRIIEAPFGSEDVLQQLIAEYPGILAGEQMDPEAPPRWLLVAREAGIPGEEGGSDRWALDHLLLDQFARPTFVEVKRSTDTRIRREWVGQMLDYAANAVVYWPVAKIRTMLAERLGGSEEADDAVADLLQGSGDDDRSAVIEKYWRDVERNLAKGQVRLLFVADEIPREQRRIIEFLNTQMPDVEVLGVALRHFASGDLRLLAPLVIGQSESTREPGAPTGRTNRERFLGECHGIEREFYEELLAEAATRGFDLAWRSRGFSLGAFRPSGDRVTLLNGYPPGSVGRKNAFLEVYLKPFLESEQPEKLRRQLLELGHTKEQGRYYVGLEIRDDTVDVARRLLSIITTWRALITEPLAGS
jgi:hypothetical protein